MNVKNFLKILILLVIIIIFFTLMFQYNNMCNKNANLEEHEEVSQEESKYFEMLYMKSSEDFNMPKNQNLTITKDVEVHTDQNTGVKYVTYEDFGAKYDEDFDNYEVIKNTHEYANQYGYEVRATPNTYHIYNLENTSPILIYTSTDWNGAQFIIHDEDISDKNVKEEALFRIDFNRNNTVIDDQETLDNIEVKKTTSKIPQLAGHGQCICLVYNSNKRQYIRSGYENSIGMEQKDIFIIDNNGNVLNEIQWDFDDITLVRLIPIPNSTIIVQNGNFKTILNGVEQENGYFERNIICYRSNTIIKNITHTVDDIEKLGGPYYGFIRISNTSNVILKDCQLYSHKYKNKSNYDLILENSVNITIDNVTSNNIEDLYRWGITGSNYTKDITYKNCVLNRIDAHCGVHNLTIEDSTIGVKGITLIGSGELNLKNVIKFGSDSFIEFRSDYGSTWNGTINIEDCTYKPTNANQIIGFKITYNNGELHDYGYDLYLPNINITNLKIEDENNTNTSNEYYIFYNAKDQTGTENGDIRNAYNLPENITINNYETTSGKKIKLFSNKFYNSLDEIGINLSIPLSDKEEVAIIDESNETIADKTITNKNIKIKIPEAEGIQTTVKINNEEIEQEELILDQEGNYQVEKTYKNSAGEQEQSIINVEIDKTPPTITGVAENKTYKYSVVPNVVGKNLKEIKLTYYGQAVENYQLGDEITEEGTYQLTATDQAGNNATVRFQIQEPTDEDYKIREGIIKNIRNNTTITEFKEKLQLSEEYEIAREGKQLEENEVIATGDILTTTSGKEYTLIVIGDVFKDGDIDINDIVKLRKYLLNKEESPLDEIESIAADANIDEEEITISDLVKMRKLVLSKPIN